MRNQHVGWCLQSIYIQPRKESNCPRWLSKMWRYSSSSSSPDRRCNLTRTRHAPFRCPEEGGTGRTARKNRREQESKSGREQERKSGQGRNTTKSCKGEYGEPGGSENTHCSEAETDERPTGWAEPPTAQENPAPHAPQLPVVVEHDEEVVAVEARPALHVQASRTKHVRINIERGAKRGEKKEAGIHKRLFENRATSRAASRWGRDQ